jgi:hypothetical protein
VNWWLSSLLGRPEKASVDSAYPFAEGKQFVLTITAGLEGYHVSVDGRHVASFPYRTVSSLYCIIESDRQFYIMENLLSNNDGQFVEKTGLQS